MPKGLLEEVAGSAPQWLWHTSGNVEHGVQAHARGPEELAPTGRLGKAYSCGVFWRVLGRLPMYCCRVMYIPPRVSPPLRLVLSPLVHIAQSQNCADPPV